MSYINQLFGLLICVTVLSTCAENSEQPVVTDSEEPVAEVQPAEPEEVQVVLQDPNDLIPEGWRELKRATGDLNKDGREDLVLALAEFDTTKFEYAETYPDTLDHNTRRLAIYFMGEDGQYKLNQSTETFIPLRESLSMSEPFEEMYITKKGVLSFRFNYWYSMGSWFTSNHTYKFRYQNNDFELIGYDSFEMHRASGETSEVSVNFSTKKIQTLTGRIDLDEPETEKWRSFELESLPKLSEFKELFSMKIDGVYI